MQITEPIRVIASAGTGKTTFYAKRLLDAMKTNKPVSVLVIMFNRNAKEDF
jgi:superfamily I DNA/RNA helicase